MAKKIKPPAVVQKVIAKMVNGIVHQMPIGLTAFVVQCRKLSTPVPLENCCQQHGNEKVALALVRERANGFVVAGAARYCKDTKTLTTDINGNVLIVALHRMKRPTRLWYSEMSYLEDGSLFIPDFTEKEDSNGIGGEMDEVFGVVSDMIRRN